MDVKKLLYIQGLCLFVFVFVATEGWAKPPVITHSFAVGKGQFGYIWKIYLEAEDPDGRYVENCYRSGPGRRGALPNRLDLS